MLRDDKERGVDYGMIKSGVSQIGGKFRLRKTILELIPYHEFYLEPFLGSAIILLNKPRCRYECGNDLNSELINYHLVVSGYNKDVQNFTTNPKKYEYDQETINMFEEMKRGVFGLVSQEICNQIVRGEIVPRNKVERAYFYYYLNKLTFGGGIWMVRKKPPMKGIDPSDQAGKFEVDGKGFAGLIDQKRQNARIDAPGIQEAKDTYEIKTKGVAGITNPMQGGFRNRETDIEAAKSKYKGLVEAKAKYSGMLNSAMKGDSMSKESIEDTKASYRGILLPTVCKDKSVKEAKVAYETSGGKNGIISAMQGGFANRDTDIKKAKKAYQTAGGIMGLANSQAKGRDLNQKGINKAKKSYKNATHKGINPKTTRPYTNNDCGLLTPIQKEAIERLRYVNLTTYPFEKVYNLFYKAFHERKGLGEECFIYIDSPYVGTEKYYKSGFGLEEHNILRDLILESPFHILQSIGGKGCEELYVDPLKDAGFIVKGVKVKYSTDANSQKESQEYLIMNYDIKKLPKMIVKHGKKIVNEPNERMSKWL